MFTSKDKVKYENTMDAFEAFGERIGGMINKKGAWVIKALIMSGFIAIFGVIILISAIARKSVGAKD